MAKKVRGIRANKPNDSFGTINSETLYRNEYKADVYKHDDEETNVAEALEEDQPEEKAAEVEALKAQLAEVKKKQLKERDILAGQLTSFTQEDKDEEIADLLTKIKELTPKKAVGGMIPSAGIYNLHEGEMVLDNAAVAQFTKALNLVNMSQQNAQATAGGGGQPVIINNNNVDNSMQSSQTTAVSIPAPTRSNESTLRALQAA